MLENWLKGNGNCGKGSLIRTPETQSWYSQAIASNRKQSQTLSQRYRLDFFNTFVLSFDCLVRMASR